MNFKQWLLAEMPINNFQLIGQWEPNAQRYYGYNKQDIGILQNPKAVEKIHNLWSKSKDHFDLYFLRSYAASKYREVGQVDKNWVKTNLHVDIQPNPNAITVIYTQNMGAEKIPMTAWAMAHRFSHAIRRDVNFDIYFTRQITKDLRFLLQDVYDINNPGPKELKALASAIGSMKSAKNYKLVNFGEFIHELVAQYIITGHIKFNSLPKNLVLKRRMVFGRPSHMIKTSSYEDAEMSEYNEVLNNYAEQYEHHLDGIFTGFYGKIFVM